MSPQVALMHVDDATFIALVRSLASEGMPVVVVSHDLEEWLQIASHVVLMSEGGVAWQGTVSALAQEPCAFAHAGLCPPEAWTLALLLARAGSMESDVRSLNKDSSYALELLQWISHRHDPSKTTAEPRAIGRRSGKTCPSCWR